MYEKIRKFAIVFFIICVVVVTVIVIFSIWGILAKDVIAKSFESLAILIVSAALIGVTTLIREGKTSMSLSSNNVVANGVQAQTPAAGSHISAGRVILYVFLVLIGLPILFSFIVGMMSYR